MLTKQVHETIVKHLRIGAYLIHAAEAAGVSYEAVRQWRKRGEAGERGYVAFFEAVRAVQAEDAIRREATISRAVFVDKDWKAAAWSLERKYPNLYGRAALEPAIGVVVGPGNTKDDDPDTAPRTRVEFYIPRNGRRPGESVPDDDADDEP